MMEIGFMNAFMMVSIVTLLLTACYWAGVTEIEEAYFDEEEINSKNERNRPE